MTEQEVQAFCANNGISVSPVGQPLHVVDPTELPASVRKFVNDDGTYKGRGLESEGADDAPEGDSDGTALKGKLPDDFPGHTALEAEGITTYAKLRALNGDYTSVPGIGEATAAKIEEALG